MSLFIIDLLKLWLFSKMWENDLKPEDLESVAEEVGEAEMRELSDSVTVSVVRCCSSASAAVIDRL